ncbi:unnamed protein product, partial [Polarella glacialis]
EVLRAGAAHSKAALSAAVDRLAQDLYELEGHFVFELVQNADDNVYHSSGGDPPDGQLVMSLRKSEVVQNSRGGRTTHSDSYFMSANDEVGLSTADVAAMCDVNASSKKDKAGCTGQKGIGWKSTFSVSDCPHLLSGSFTFKFDIAGPLGKMGYVTPTWITDDELLALPLPVREEHEAGNTVVYLPLRSESVMPGIAQAFDRLCEHHVSLLFFRRLRRIGLVYSDSLSVWLRREEVFNHQAVARVTRQSGSSAVGGSEAEEVHRYLLHSSELIGELKEALTRLSPRAPRLSLAFPLGTYPGNNSTKDNNSNDDGNNNNSHNTNSHNNNHNSNHKKHNNLPSLAVHVGLPVRRVGFCFAVDGPFDLVASRADLHEGSPVNRILCDAIPHVFAEALSLHGELLSSSALALLGPQEAPTALWRQVRLELATALRHVACVPTEDGSVARPGECLERPRDARGRAASQLVPPLLLEMSCGRRFAASSATSSDTGSLSSAIEALGVDHWVKILSFRGGLWPDGLVGAAVRQSAPWEFFLPLCAWLQAELADSEQPSELLQQFWDVDLLPALAPKQSLLPLSAGPLLLRPCMKLRHDWQRWLCEAGVLKILEPRIRMALEGSVPQLLAAVAVAAPQRSEVAAACAAWHATGIDGSCATDEPTLLQAVLASLACLKETFLADEVPAGGDLWAELPLPKLRSHTPEERFSWWRELGTWLWIPAVAHAGDGGARLRLARPKDLICGTYLGFSLCSPRELAAIGGSSWIAPELLHAAWGEDALGWEAFLDAVGVEVLSPASPRAAAVLSQPVGAVSSRLGAQLSKQDWWAKVVKAGQRVRGYVSRVILQADHAESSWLRGLPVVVAECSGHGSRDHPGRQQSICFAGLFLYETYARLGGQFLPYVRLPAGDGLLTAAPSSLLFIQSCLQALGVQVEISVPGLVRCLQVLREGGRCQNAEAFADIYKEVASLSMKCGDISEKYIEDSDVVGICVSGGLDSKTVALRLRLAGVKVKCFCADIGQPDEEDINDIPKKMAPCGVETIIVDLKDEIAEGAFEAVAAGASYDGGYWQSTGIGRYVTARGLLQEMKKHGCTVLSSGPVLLEEFPGRTQMLSYLENHGIGHTIVSQAKKRYSTDANILGLSNEAEDLESMQTPMTIVNPVMGKWPKDAPDKQEEIEMRFEQGRCVKINGKAVTAFEALTQANQIAGRNGIGLSQALENRILGTKSRGVYEAPGMVLLAEALKTVYQAVLDRRSTNLSKFLSTHVSDQVYDGRYFGPSTRCAINAVWELAEPAKGTVKLGLYKGHMNFLSLTDCPHSIYFEEDSSMEASSGLNPASSQGFLEVSSVEAKSMAKAGLIDYGSVWSKR